MYTIKLRTSAMGIMFYVVLFVIITLPSVIYADPIDSSVHVPPVCDPHCGCDGIYIYDEAKGECILNLFDRMKRVEVRYDNQSEDLLLENGMAKSIYIEGQKIFRGILISVMLFMTCAAICVISACIYCCRIDYTDRKLKNEVKSLAKKMNKSYKSGAKPPKVHEQKAQSCNVVVEDAGVFVC